MEKNRVSAAVALVVLTSLLNACTWVKTTPEGDSVRVASADAVSGCGALLGGDTVVAETAVADGRQVFGVYRCAR